MKFTANRQPVAHSGLARRGGSTRMRGWVWIAAAACWRRARAGRRGRRRARRVRAADGIRAAAAGHLPVAGDSGGRGRDALDERGRPVRLASLTQRQDHAADVFLHVTASIRLGARLRMTRCGRCVIAFSAIAALAHEVRFVGISLDPDARHARRPGSLRQGCHAWPTLRVAISDRALGSRRCCRCSRISART